MGSALVDAFDGSVSPIQTACGQIQSAVSSATEQIPGEFATATEEAGSNFNDLSEQADETGTHIQTTFSTLGDNLGATMATAAQNMQSSLTQAANVTVSVPTVTAGGGEGDEEGPDFTQTAISASQAATGIATLGMSVYNLQASQTSLDRANVTVERDTNSVTTAQETYNKTVATYGENSPQATDAANKLSTAQAALQVAHERVTEAQDNMNRTMIMTGLSVVPSVTSAFTGLSTVVEAFPEIGTAMSGVVDGMSFSFDALNTSLIVVVAVVAIGMAIYEAYQHCAPFRDAINEIGTVLGGAFSTALTDIKNGLTFLWNDVFVPFGTFIENTFIGYFDGLKTAWNILGDAFDWVNKNILQPIWAGLQTVYNDTLKPIIDAMNTVSNIGKAVGGAVGGALKSIGLAEGGIVYSPTLALIGEAGPEAVVPLGNSNSSVFGAAGVSPLEMNSVPAAAGPGINPENVTLYVTSTPTIQINGLSSNASLPEIISAVREAVDRGQANSLVTSFSRALAMQQSRR